MFAHTADVYAPDDAGNHVEGMIRTTTDIQRLDPGSNVPKVPAPFNPVVAIAGLVALIAIMHHYSKGGKRR